MTLDIRLALVAIQFSLIAIAFFLAGYVTGRRRSEPPNVSKPIITERLGPCRCAGCTRLYDNREP